MALKRGHYRQPKCQWPVTSDVAVTLMTSDKQSNGRRIQVELQPAA